MCFRRWSEPLYDSRDGESRRAVQMVTERRAEVPQARRAVLGVVVMLMLMLMVMAIVVVRDFLNIRPVVVVRETAMLLASLVLTVEVDDRIADVDVIIAMERMVGGRRNDSPVAVDENRPCSYGRGAQ